MISEQLLYTLTACGAGRLHRLESGFETGHPKASHRKGNEMTELLRQLFPHDPKAAVGATR